MFKRSGARVALSQPGVPPHQQHELSRRARQLSRAQPQNTRELTRRAPQVQAPKLPDQLRKPTCRARSEAAAATLPRTASYARSTLYSRQDADGAAPDKPWERCQCGL